MFDLVLIVDFLDLVVIVNVVYMVDLVVMVVMIKTWLSHLVVMKTP